MESTIASSPNEQETGLEVVPFVPVIQEHGKSVFSLNFGLDPNDSDVKEPPLNTKKTPLEALLNTKKAFAGSLTNKMQVLEVVARFLHRYIYSSSHYPGMNFMSGNFDRGIFNHVGGDLYNIVNAAPSRYDEADDRKLLTCECWRFLIRLSDWHDETEPSVRLQMFMSPVPVCYLLLLTICLWVEAWTTLIKQ